MSRNKIYLNLDYSLKQYLDKESREHYRRREEIFNRLVGARPLDGTNQSWRYNSEEKRKRRTITNEICSQD